MTTVENPSFRFQSDRRQFGGMLMILGFCAVVQPLANIVSGFGPNGLIQDEPDEIPLWRVVGAFCLFIMGATAVMVGYLASIHDWSHQYLTGFLIIIIQTAFIPYITGMVDQGKMGRHDEGLIPPTYEHSQTDSRFVGAMGVLAVFCYGFSFVGSFAFMAFALHAFNRGAYTDRNAQYYASRMMFYCAMLFIGGLVQFLLGVYTASKFEGDVLREGPVKAAMILVTYPGVAIVVGLVQLINACWGLLRSTGIHGGPEDIKYQVSIALQWVLVLCFQDIMQIAYLGAGTAAALAPTVAAFSLGLNMMPAYLDHKMRNTPEVIAEEYYFVGIGSNDKYEATENMHGRPENSDNSPNPPSNPHETTEEVVRTEKVSSDPHKTEVTTEKMVTTV